MCFAGQLPELPIVLSDAKSFVGRFCYHRTKNVDGTFTYSDYRLAINTRLDLPQTDLDDTILHEMIHYFVTFNKLPDSSAHGPMFRHIMNEINTKYGRHITISHKVTEAEKEQLTDQRPRWHVIAVVDFNDGRYGIKVLPRVLPKILKYYNFVSGLGEVSTVSLFMSNNPYFNRFPTSAALKVEIADKGEVEQQLEGAERLGCDGTSLQRNC